MEFNSLSLSINEVVIRTGLTAYTLRYYERIGLILPVARAPGGQRRYAAADMDWLDFLLRLRTTGMPIHRMQMFAQLRTEGNATARARRELLENHFAEVTAQIALLQESAQVLQTKIAYYAELEDLLVIKKAKLRSKAQKQNNPITT
jgi:DNA-binding transcriptional MerR regulator